MYAIIGIIVLLLFMNFKNVVSVLIILGTLPLSLVGGYWLLRSLKDPIISTIVGVEYQ